MTKSGAINCDGWSSVSRTSERSAGLARRRRGRSAPGILTAGLEINSRIFPRLQWNRSLDRRGELVHIRTGGLGDDREARVARDGGGTRADGDRRQTSGAAKLEKPADRRSRRKHDGGDVALIQRSSQLLGRFSR